MKAHSTTIPTGFFNYFTGCFHGSPGGKEVVNDQYAASLINTIFVHFDSIVAIFQLVIHAIGFCRELPRFSDRDETFAQQVSNDPGDNETP